MKPSISMTRKAASGTKETTAASIASGVKAELGKDGLSADLKDEAEKTKDSETTRSRENSFTIEESQIVADGRPSSPAWKIEEKEGKNKVIGGLKKEYLGFCTQMPRLARFGRK